MSGQADTSAKPRIKAHHIAMIGLFVALTTVGAYIRIPGPLVPFTAQFFFCTMGGILLGAKRGFAAQCIYIALGLIGIPVFTGGGGFSYVLQPTFGYLLGFAVCALVAGLLSTRLIKRNKLNFVRMLLVCILCLAIVYLIAVPYYLLIQRFYFGNAAGLGYTLELFVLPFLLTDFLWCLLLASTAPRIRKAVKRYL